MKHHIQEILQQAIHELQSQNLLAKDVPITIQVEYTRDAQHGDFASNIALMLAKGARCQPLELARKIVAVIPATDSIEKISVAGPGFINFKLANNAFFTLLAHIKAEGERFGCVNLGNNKRIHIEFVSANPTGPLHVGHGRSAAYGACVVNLLRAIGYQVHSEYYVNDAGRQMRILALSIWLRYLEILKVRVVFPANAYQGDYVCCIAKKIVEERQQEFCKSWDEIQRTIPEDLDPMIHKDQYIDALIEIAVNLLGEKQFAWIQKQGLDTVLSDIVEDLDEFGVQYDNWFKESDLHKKGWLEEGINLLRQQGHTYEKEGTLWFAAISLGDDKDRVLVRKNGQPTYFAYDVAYHLYKYNQGYDQIIDIFGADHHGYTQRLHAFLKGLGKVPEKLMVLLVQFAVLYRGTEKVAMSTRSGEFVTLRELRQEVGNDAARYFYIMRKPEQHLDFDLELAKSQSNDNPIYYIQYAHARICSVWRQLDSKHWVRDDALGMQNLHLLKSTHEQNLLRTLSHYPDIMTTAAVKYEPHLLANYLQQLATDFHSYYNATKFLVEEAELRNARLCLIAGAQQVLSNSLRLLGLTAPQVM